MNEEKGMRGAAVGFALGLLLFGGIGGLVGFGYVKRTEDKYHRGWNLVPVLVARTDLAGGAPVRVDDVVEHAVPEQFVTDTVAKNSELRSVVGQTLVVPVKAGEPIHWWMLVGGDALQGSKDTFEATIACSKAATVFERYKTTAQVRSELKEPQ